MNVRDIIPWSRSAQPLARYEGEQNPFLSLHREMNRLFDDVFRGFDAPLSFGRLAPLGTGWPRLEITDQDKDLKVTAEVPGLEEKDIEVLLDDGVLTLRGERTSETSDKDRQFSERFYGWFERRIPLDYPIAEDKVSAAFKNGVLTVTLPKSEPAPDKSKRIAINGKS
jgi:HSP20 family protein